MEANGKILTIFLIAALVISLVGNYVQSTYSPTCDNSDILEENQRLFDTIDSQLEEIRILNIQLSELNCGTTAIATECEDNSYYVDYSKRLSSELSGCNDLYWDLRNSCEANITSLTKKLNETTEKLQLCQHKSSGGGNQVTPQEEEIEPEPIDEEVPEEEEIPEPEKKPCKKTCKVIKPPCRR
jgi:hypothetical protein